MLSLMYIYLLQYMYVCMYVCLYVCMYVCMYVSTRLHITLTLRSPGQGAKCVAFGAASSHELIASCNCRPWQITLQQVLKAAINVQ